MNAAKGAVLTIEGLRIVVRNQPDRAPLVDGLDLTIESGEVVGLVGESGSGKSLTALAVMGLLPPALQAEGRIMLMGDDLSKKTPKQRRKLCGLTSSMVFQEPSTSLSPYFTVGFQIMESMTCHGMKKLRARERMKELLDAVRLPNASDIAERYPHQLSGGQRQRVAIAIALANRPALIIADEPTTALDVTVQRQVLDLMLELQRQEQTSLMFITHDLGVVRHVAARVCVMQSGKAVETGTVHKVFSSPSHPYTRKLLRPFPLKTRNGTPDKTMALAAESVSVTYGRGSQATKVVHGVSLKIPEGRTVAVVGESGSGKTSLGMGLLGLAPSRGRVVFMGETHQLGGGSIPSEWRRALQVVFQDPYASLSPRMTINDIIAEGLKIQHPELTESDRTSRVSDMLESVGLPSDARQRWPHEFSGGQRQRIAIARALVMRPKLIILDEPTSALDRTLQVQIVRLLSELQDSMELTFLFITHDIEVVASMSDYVLVMHHGEVVDKGTTAKILNNPQHPYTKELLESAKAYAL